jgi:hypothetical protein
MKILVNTSVGELLDKFSVLEIKKEKIKDSEKLIEINRELEILKKICDENLKDYDTWVKKLKEINLIIWDNIGKQWKKYNAQEYNENCIDLSKEVIINNDKRFQIKDEINQFYGSQIKEQKSYEDL